MKRTARNAPRYAAAPPAAVKEAAASLWDVKLSADRLGRGMDGSIYQVTRGNAGGLVAKFMRASEWGKAEAALTDLILVEQRTPDSSANPYRVIFPAVVEGLILMDAREKPAWYVTLREDVEPVQAVHEEKCSDGDMRSCALLRATNELWDATDSFFYSATAEEPDKAEESLDDALAHVERAERDAPAAMKGVADAISELTDRDVLLWDMHDGNWALRTQRLPRWGAAGRFVAMDYGRSSIRDEDVLARASSMLNLRRTKMNPRRVPFASWRRVRL